MVIVHRGVVWSEVKYHLTLDECHSWAMCSRISNQTDVAARLENVSDDTKIAQQNVFVKTVSVKYKLCSLRICLHLSLTMLSFYSFFRSFLWRRIMSEIHESHNVARIQRYAVEESAAWSPVSRNVTPSHQNALHCFLHGQWMGSVETTDPVGTSQQPAGSLRLYSGTATLWYKSYLTMTTLTCWSSLVILFSAYLSQFLSCCWDFTKT